MMKQLSRIVSLTLAAVILCITLSACGGGFSGKYYTGDLEQTKTYTTYEFKGGKLTVEGFLYGARVEAQCYVGEYKLEDDVLTIVKEGPDGEEQIFPFSYRKLENGEILVGNEPMYPMK